MKILHVNATRTGGGVAELLTSLVPSLREDGYDVDWFVPKFPDDFFTITKKFHNALQGVSQDISLAEIARYIEVCESIELPVADLYIMHDPQVLPIHIPEGKKSVWRIHIETTEAERVLASIMIPMINKHDGIITTDQKYIDPMCGEGMITIPSYEINPTIDLDVPKNRPHTGEYAQKHLDLPKGVPIIAGVSRYDPHKGQEDLIKAFKAMNHPTAHLVLLGNIAADDPEGQVIYEYIKTMYASDKIHIIQMNDIHAVGSLMALADVYVQFSSKEGFGLVVAEAMNQGTLTIGSNVGGIPKQVIDGETGILVESGDVATLTEKMQYALAHPSEMEGIAARGQQYIRDNFTLNQLKESHIATYEAVLTE